MPRTTIVKDALVATGLWPMGTVRVKRWVTRQAISSAMHEVEGLGYLGRQLDAHDGRGVVFTLTHRGQHLVGVYDAQLDEIERRYESMEEQPEPVPPAVRTGVLRTDAELAELAADLLRWLGDGDTARLGELLSQQMIEQRRLARFPRPVRAETEPRGPDDSRVARRRARSHRGRAARGHRPR